MSVHETIVAVEGGRVMDLFNLTLQDVLPETLAGPLSRINRFNGRTPKPWSVAAHSVVVMSVIEAQGGTAMAQAAGALHDAHEALLGDITSPTAEFAGLQSLPVGPAVVRSCLVQAKARVDLAIANAYHVEFTPNLPTTRATDRAVLEAEMITFLDWRGPVTSDPDLLSLAIAHLGIAVELGFQDAEYSKDVWLQNIRSLIGQGVLTDPEATIAA